MALKFRLFGQNYKRLSVSDTSLLSDMVSAPLKNLPVKRRKNLALATAGMLSVCTVGLAFVPAENGLHDSFNGQVSFADNSFNHSLLDNNLSNNLGTLDEEYLTNRPLAYAYGHANHKQLIPIPEASYTAVMPEWETIKIIDGDTLSGLFSRLEIPQTEWRSVLALDGHTHQLTKLRVGDTLDIAVDDNKSLTGIRYQFSEAQTLEVVRKREGLTEYTLDHPPEVREVRAEGTIQSSLSVDAHRAGVPISVIMKAADIFAWDIDFTMDIQRGDKFAFVYEEIWANGELKRTGKVLAAQFINRNRKHSAVYYSNEDGFAGHFTPEGRSLRKAFLRSPLKFSRISSKFNLNRRHPILNTIRAHKGVDYAAAAGTPINAAGSGRVKFAGWKRGYGRTLVIKHPGGVETLYAHLQNFAGDLKQGDKVTQGQLVAYVGSTGLATGPHLHYEFRKNGRHQDPLSVDLPRAVPMPKEYLADFNKQSDSLVARLNGANENDVSEQAQLSNSTNSVAISNGRSTSMLGGSQAKTRAQTRAQTQAP